MSLLPRPAPRPGSPRLRPPPLTARQLLVLAEVDRLTYAADNDGWVRAAQCAAACGLDNLAAGGTLAELRRRDLVERRMPTLSLRAGAPVRTLYRIADAGAEVLRAAPAGGRPCGAER